MRMIMSVYVSSLMSFTLLQLLFFSLTEATSPIIIAEQSISFSQIISLNIPIPNDYLSQQIIFEVNVTPKLLPQTAGIELIMFAAEPNVNLPDFYTVFFEYQKLSKYVGSEIHFDLEGFSSLRSYQLIQIQSLTVSQVGSWTIGLFDLKSDKTQSYQAHLRILALPQNEKYCPYNCNQSLNSANTCETSTTIMKKMCSCADQYIGSFCSYFSQTSQFNEQKQVFVYPLQWAMLSYNISQYSSSELKLSMRLAGDISKLKLGVVYGGISDIFVPNILNDVYSISQVGAMNQEYPMVIEKINLMFDKAALLNTTKFFPEHNQNYDQVITIGFYNENPSSESIFFFELVSSSSESDSMFSKTALILFTSLGCAIVFCISPITYYCMKQHQKQRQQLLKSVLFENESPNNQGNSQQIQQQQQQVSLQLNINQYVTTELGQMANQQQQQQQLLLQSGQNQQQQHIQSTTNCDQIQLRGLTYDSIPPSITSRNGQPPSSSRQSFIRRGDIADLEALAIIHFNNNNRNNYLAGSNNNNNNPHNNMIIPEINANIQSQQQQQQVPKKPVRKIVPITKETINKFMPKQKHKDILRLYPTLKDEGEECTVCLETFEEDTECRITPCFHLFHSDCLESWFKKHSTCPYCRASCNRKGIVQQLQHGSTNSYVQRIQYALSEVKKAIIGHPNRREEDCLSDPSENKAPSPLSESALRRRALQNNNEAQQVYTTQPSHHLPSQVNNLNSSLRVVQSQTDQKNKEKPLGATQRFKQIAGNILNSLKKPVQNLLKKDSSFHTTNTNYNNNNNSLKLDRQDEHQQGIPAIQNKQSNEYFISPNNFINQNNNMNVNNSDTKEMQGFQCLSPALSSRDQSYQLPLGTNNMLSGRHLLSFDDQRLSPLTKQPIENENQAHFMHNVLQSDEKDQQFFSPQAQFSSQNFKGFRSIRNNLANIDQQQQQYQQQQQRHSENNQYQDEEDNHNQLENIRGNNDTGDSGIMRRKNQQEIFELPGNNNNNNNNNNSNNPVVRVFQQPQGHSQPIKDSGPVLVGNNKNSVEEIQSQGLESNLSDGDDKDERQDRQRRLKQNQFQDDDLEKNNNQVKSQLDELDKEKLESFNEKQKHNDQIKSMQIVNELLVLEDPSENQEQN